jgi:preprotein translocase subunit SecG
MIFWQLPSRQPVFEDLMETIQKGVLIAHTLIALGIIALVLLQRGKGADAGAAFGAGASGTVFGARGAGSFFSRATAVLATAFFASSLTLAYLSSQRVSDPERLIENAQPATDQAEVAQDLVEEAPVDVMPALEPEATDDSAELPTPGEELPGDGSE